MRNIVIIDDDLNVLEGMREVIPWEELDAVWAGEALNGEEGIELVSSVRPDIIITDIYMPVMDGLTMIERLRADDFTGKVVILSGYSDFEHARKALRLDVSDYLSKPLSAESIRQVLANVIGQLEDEARSKREVEELKRKMRMLEPMAANAAWSRDDARSDISGADDPGGGEICGGERQAGESIRHKQAAEFMLRYVHEHYGEDITVEELAEQLHISTNYLRSIFRKVTGETFNQYVTRVRIEKAKDLLMEGKYYIYEIAELVGYKNVTYFSTLFKKYTGVTPKGL
ncbi:putative response regulatory protein [Paenibacillus sp. CECT 9249]|uniref:response regulator transcription factor n=1 Tax=Paenibacillus sp. CECT 9249 TaxID=2845385 RepID=UPI001E4CCE60|nr:response regulator [Paenibacillus sp. CECT 9249]CAH0120200.1 putative response regulatory protein [Paenibacillus sp. CECT 9249]